MDTVTINGVAPDDGVAISQPVSEIAEIETFGVPIAEESSMVWLGVVTPVWVLNVSCCGVATTALVWASAVSTQHSAAVISPKVNSISPVFFTTYSKSGGFI